MYLVLNQDDFLLYYMFLLTNSNANILEISETK